MKTGHGLALVASALTLAACDRASVNPDGTIGSAISSSVVISQVYAGGGNTGATYHNDFVELFNKSAAPVNLNTWSIQYSTGTGTGWGANTTSLTGTIAAGGYYLVGLDSGGNVGLLLPTPDDQDLTTTMATGGGKVALVSNTTALTGTCPTSLAIVDFIGWGSANCSEGTKLGALANATAAIRKNTGCRDTDRNNADFSIATPSPRNSASPAVATCAPYGVGAGNPNPVGQGGTTLLTVRVTSGTIPPSTSFAVVANLSAILGSSGQVFFDDGSNGDLSASDDVFSFETLVGDTVTAGAKALPFTVTDAEARVDTSGTFTLNVEANAAPVAVDDTFSVLFQTARSLAVLANDTDADSDPLAIVEITFQGTRGVAAITSSGAAMTYTPGAGQLGLDTFGYRITDGLGEFDEATVTVSIVEVIAENDAFAATEETQLVVAAPGVLVNDSAAGNPPLTSSVVAPPANGALALSSDGSFTYTGATNFFGADTFTYRTFTGSALSNVATVTITVANTQDPPTAVTDTYSVTEDTTLTRTSANGVLANDTDPDLQPLRAILVTAPARGVLTLATNGSFVYVPGLNDDVDDSFTYHANDGLADSGVVTVVLDLTAVNDAPIAIADAYSLDEDTPILVVTSGLLVNDTDVEGSALTVVVVDAPDNGTFTNMGAGFLYEPDLDYAGTDTMTYVANDGGASSVTPATVTFTIAAINDAPTAVSDTFATDEDVPLVVLVATGILANDDDVDGDAILPVVDAQPENGTLALATDGSLTWSPSADFNGTDTFTYHLSDGVESSTIATVTLSVDPLNDAPTVPQPVSPAAGEERSAKDLVFTWSASADVDGDAIEYRVQVFRDGNLYAQAQSSGTTATIPGELPKGDFTWRVQADDGVDDSGFSAEASFTIKASGGDSRDAIFGCSTTGASGGASGGATTGALLAAATVGVFFARRRAQ